MGDVFVRRIACVDRRGQGAAGDRLQDLEPNVSVHSAFDLPAAQQSAIDSAIKETFAPDALVQFETAPELVSGIELSANGQKVAWSIADYLATLEKSVGELLHVDAAESEPDSKVKPEARGDGQARTQA